MDSVHAGYSGRIARAETGPERPIRTTREPSQLANGPLAGSIDAHRPPAPAARLLLASIAWRFRGAEGLGNDCGRHRGARRRRLAHASQRMLPREPAQGGICRLQAASLLLGTSMGSGSGPVDLSGTTGSLCGAGTLWSDGNSAPSLHHPRPEILTSRAWLVRVAVRAISLSATVDCYCATRGRRGCLRFCELAR